MPIKLYPVDSRKDFYSKCRVETEKGNSNLISYTTKVVQYNHQTGIMSINGWYSATTARHINSFLDYFQFSTMTKREMMDTAGVPFTRI